MRLSHCLTSVPVVTLQKLSDPLLSARQTINTCFSKEASEPPSSPSPTRALGSGQAGAQCPPARRCMLSISGLVCCFLRLAAPSHCLCWPTSPPSSESMLQGGSAVGTCLAPLTGHLTTSSLSDSPCTSKGESADWY